MCSSDLGGCSICVEYHGRALEVQERWKEKALRLGILLSAKRHEVSQRGAFTGIGIDTFRGVFFMLDEKLRSMRDAIVGLLGAAHTTPRLVARVRGKALHYGCALPFVALAAPSLSQLMHGAESSLGPCAVPSLREEEAAPFEWDRPIALSRRARSAQIGRAHV